AFAAAPLVLPALPAGAAERRWVRALPLWSREADEHEWEDGRPMLLVGTDREMVIVDPRQAAGAAPTQIPRIPPPGGRGGGGPAPPASTDRSPSRPPPARPGRRAPHPEGPPGRFRGGAERAGSPPAGAQPGFRGCLARRRGRGGRPPLPPGGAGSPPL